MSEWVEVGDRVFVRRYRFFDQDIAAILTDAGPVVVDTRTTFRQADETIGHLRELDARPTAAVIDTHGHYDHTFGNRRFRPAPIWAHERCVTMLERSGEAMRAGAAAEIPAIADDLAEVVIDVPDRTFTERALVDVGGRTIDLRYLGRGHTDNDIVVLVPDADVLCAGDLLENDAVPYFGDGFPMDWPATAAALLELVGPATAVVPGHGSVAGRAFVERQLGEFRAIAELASRVDAGDLDLGEAIAAAPYPAAQAREPLERALHQLRGELDAPPA